jgi:ubiquinone/menaquinone biosynthesis C-methylase UbiE
MELQSHKKHVKEYFDSLSETYLQERYEDINDSRSYYFQSRKRRVIEMFDLEGGKVLDAGCGPGVIVLEFLRKGCEVYGIDLSPKMIAEAKQRFINTPFKSKVHFSVGDIEKLDFPGNYFDAVICLGVLPYLENGNLAIREISRVLKPNGFAIISTLNKVSPGNMLKMSLRPLIRFIARVSRKNMIKDRGLLQIFKFKYYTPHQLDRILIESGFKKIDYSFNSFTLFPINILLPSLSISISMKMERFARTRLGCVATEYIVKVIKSSRK